MQHAFDKYVRYYRSKGPVVLLESQSSDHPAANCSYLAACPEATIKVWNTKVEIKEGEEITTFTKNPWDALRAFQKKWSDWLFGYLGYDLKNHIEVLESKNPDVLEAPDLFFMVPGVILKIDSDHSTITAIKGTMPDTIPVGEFEEKTIQINNLHSTVSKENYIVAIERAQRQIYEGTYYEINLSHQLQANFQGDAFQLYKKMRTVGPVPFGAFLTFDDFSVCSLSPERFLCKKGTSVFSQPIKGTIKRDENQQQDTALRNRLIGSSKDRAENLMIVDLVRNDLSRIARRQTVEVSDLFEIQTFGTVHQMVSTIQAQTDVQDPVEIVKACYPMGSMTGAPKISCMQSIETLENYRRGIYSGAIGYFNPERDFDLNVVIRTAIIKNNLLCYAVGGAITSDSNPESEWDETWLKAQALMKTLG